MAGGSDFRGKLTGLFKGLKQAAGDAVETSQVTVSRGKTAARDVVSDSGEMIVEAGRIIDDAVIDHARRTGKLAALAASAVASQAQDFREKARTAYESTPDGIEARSLASSEQYIEARAYIGWIAATDVTDIRGNIVVPAGKKIEDEDVRAVREAGQLSALIYSARQSPPPSRPVVAAAPPPGPVKVTPAQAQRTARPLSSYYDEDEEEEKE
jgi:hypothetical protein